jgi:hypothetical protein
MIRKAAHEQLGMLASRDAEPMARQGLEMVSEFLHR